MHDEHKVGYLRLTNFSQKAAADLKRHLVKLEVRTALLSLFHRSVPPHHPGVLFLHISGYSDLQCQMTA